MKMKCPKCGAIFEEGAKFCPECGVQFKQPEPKVEEPIEAIPEPAFEEPKAAPAQTYVSTQPTAAPTGKGKKGMGVAFSIISLIIGLPLFVTTAFAVFSLVAIALSSGDSPILDPNAEWVQLVAGMGVQLGLGCVLGDLPMVILINIFSSIAKKKTDCPKGLSGFARVIAGFTLAFYIILVVVFVAVIVIVVVVLGKAYGDIINSASGTGELVRNLLAVL